MAQKEAPQAADDLLKKVISHAKEYGFVFPSSEIYDGLGAVYDYGQNGVELKNNLRQYWWKSMVQMHENIVGLDSAIFMHPKIWKASGHVDGFSDPMIDNRDSKKRYRADQLLEEHIDKLQAAAATDPAGAESAEAMLAQRVQHDMDRFLNENNLAAVYELIKDLGIKCPISGTANWTEVRQFNLMYSTQMGSVADESDEVYLRPETAQGIFVNFLNVQKTGRMKIPFGIAQTGKAFRNEIVARQFIMRMREFEQMEMQYFVRPGTEMEWYEYWKAARLKWHQAIGVNPAHLKYHDHSKLAHYANAAVDIEYKFPFGFKEVEGIHSRTDFDLGRHQQYSGKKQQYFDPEINQNYVPYVVETSVGLDRIFLIQLCENLVEEDLSTPDKKDERIVLKLNPLLAPVKLAVFPLVKKDGLPDKARQIMNELKLNYNCHYEEKDTIGKRYRRHDAIGTPYCITVDYDTMSDDTVTLRNRDTMQQERIPVGRLKEILDKSLNWATVLS